MKPHFFYSLIVLVFACKGNRGGDPQTDALGKDSSVAQANKEEHYRYHIEGNLFIVRDNQRKVADTLQFANLLLQLNWDGDSDYRHSEFIEYQGDSLKILFGIGYLNVIRRKDANTLVGLASDRDELVNNFQDDYPFTVTLTDNKVVYEKPAIQYIGFPSEVLSDVEGYRLSSNGDTIPFVISRGMKIEVDTLYRVSNKVKLLIKDLPPVYAEPEKVKDKIIGNNAG